jgi:aryl-phospho-beta-D-glucosidase BglC (GH1 family)
VDEDGQQVDLRGLNLGNWLQLEFWMMGSHMRDGGAAIQDQCGLEGLLSERFGHQEKERLMTVYRDSWMTERDWDLVAALNINLVRIPFMFNLIEDETSPMNVRQDAWVHLDWAIQQAEARGIYVILDLHGAVGSQGWEQHSGCADRNELWGSEEYRARTLWLWEQIADRYKDRSAILGHGLLNEPWGTDAETLAAYSYELYDAVRARDPNHVGHPPWAQRGRLGLWQPQRTTWHQQHRPGDALLSGLFRVAHQRGRRLGPQSVAPLQCPSRDQRLDGAGRVRVGRAHDGPRDAFLDR